MTINRIAATLIASAALIAAPATASAFPLFGSLGGGTQTIAPVGTDKTIPSEAGRYVTLSDCTHSPADDRWVPVEEATCGDDAGIITAIVHQDGSVDFLSFQAY